MTVLVVRVVAGGPRGSHPPRVSRGESPKSTPRVGAIGVWSVFLMLLVGVIWLVASQTHGCGAEVPEPAPPFAGAAARVAELSWRDCVDPPVTAGSLRARLLARGYQPADTAPLEVELPFDRPVEGLAGACGVALVAGAPGASLTAVAAGDGPGRAPCASPFAAVGVCGEDRLRLQGVGQASVYALLYPGLTAGDPARTGLPADVLLAHAEAEHLWALSGWSPSGPALRVPIAAGASRWAPPTPASGCARFVIVGEGLSYGQTAWEGIPYAYDRATGRLLVGSVSCADRGAPEVLFSDLESDGGALYVLPYAAGVGPRVPGTERALSRLPEVRLTDDPATLELAPTDAP